MIHGAEGHVTLDYAELVDARLDSDAVLLAAEDCRRYVMRHAKNDGIFGTDLHSAVRSYRALDPHDRQRVQVLLVKMPTISSLLSRRGALRFWPAHVAPFGAFNIMHKGR